MFTHETIVVESPQNVAIGQHETIAEKVTRIANCAAGAEQLLLTAVFDANAERVAPPKVRFDDIGVMSDEKDELFQPARCEGIDDVFEERTPGDHDHRLRQATGERAEASTETTGEDGDFHIWSAAAMPAREAGGMAARVKAAAWPPHSKNIIALSPLAALSTVF